MFANSGDSTPPCGVPHFDLLPPSRWVFPSSLFTSTGAFSHILSRCSVRRSLILRATLFHQLRVRDRRLTPIPARQSRRDALRTRAPSLHRHYVARRPARAPGQISPRCDLVLACVLRRIPRRVRPPESVVLGGRRWPSPLSGRLGTPIKPFGACSGFTRVAARTLADPPPSWANVPEASAHRSPDAPLR